MMIYGKQAVTEALPSGKVTRLMLADSLQKGTLRELETLARQHHITYQMVPRNELDRQLKTTNHQGVAAELKGLGFTSEQALWEILDSLSELPLLVLLDQITDPQNYGAIVRSAEVLGAHAVITEARRSAPFSAAVMKASAGAAAHVPLVQVTNLPRFMETLKARDFWLYGAAGEASQPPSNIDWSQPCALIIGSEGTGMRRVVRQSCDAFVAIPMRGHVLSLNASVATGILIYEVMRSRYTRS